MFSFERYGWTGTGRALSAVCLIGMLAAPAMGQWLNYDNETSSRLLSDPNLGANDTEEKDYIWGDIDQDGDIDLISVRKQPFTSPGRRRNVLFMNEGIADGQSMNGVLVDRTDELIPEFLDLTNDRDVQLVDVNGDGWDDIVTATTISDGLPKAISHPRIYISQGEVGGVFQGFVYEEARIPQLFTVQGLAVAPRFCSVAVGDVTGDDAPDLYFGDYDSSGVNGSPQPPGFDLNDRLLINDGNGVFTDQTAARMHPNVSLSAFGMASVIADMNNDGLNDIVRDTALNVPQHVSIAYNDPNNIGNFSLANRDVVYEFSPYHIFVGDLNNDDLLDIVVTDDFTDRYLINTGIGADGRADFTRRDLIGSEASAFGGNNIIADFNKDGWPDVYVASADVDINQQCNRPSHIFRNEGDAPIVTLRDPDGQMPWEPGGSHDIAVFDLNDDDWLDLIVGDCFSTKVWINNSINVDFSYPSELPQIIQPGGTEVLVDIDIDATESAAPIEDSFTQHVSVNGGPFVESPLTDLGNGSYAIQLPDADCPSTINYYVSFESENGTVFTEPAGGEDAPNTVIVAFGTETIVEDTFEADSGWTVTNQNVTNGAWERVNPVGTTSGGQQAQPDDDFGDGSDSFCFVTGQHNGGGSNLSDLDGGPTILTSPVIDLEGSNAIITYARWQFWNSGSPDALTTEVTNDGSNWEQVDQTFGTNSSWELHSFIVGDYVTPTSTVQVRFISSDNPNNSVTESAIDNFVVNELQCNDDAGPEIVHGAAGTSFADTAFGGFIDSRRESTDGASINQGINAITIAFNEPVVDLGSDTLTMNAFTLSETGGGTPPSITSMDVVDERTVRLNLDRIITIGEWLTVTAAVEDLVGNPILNEGNLGPDVDEADRIDIAFLPADVDSSGNVTPFDLLNFRQIVNGSTSSIRVWM